jgi:hypothetical protein
VVVDQFDVLGLNVDTAKDVPMLGLHRIVSAFRESYDGAGTD